MSGSSQYKFGVLAKIVKHMKARHQDGDDHPLTLEEILDETNQLDVGSKVRIENLTNVYYSLQFSTNFDVNLFCAGQAMATNGSVDGKPKN